jgi:hypothetical protein
VSQGIFDGASDYWVHTADRISPTSERWVIRQEGAGKRSDLTEIPDNHIITIRDNASPEQMSRAMTKIAASGNDLTVMVDMRLSPTWIAPGKTWTTDTHWAANVVQALAEQRRQDFPSSETTWIGHSAGTEPMKYVEEQMRSRGGAKALFDHMIAMSPRDLTGLPKQALCVIADGDFLSSPDGHLPLKSFVSVADEAYDRKLADDGYNVLRIKNEGRVGEAAMASAAASVASNAMQLSTPASVGLGFAVREEVLFKQAKAAHTASTDTDKPNLALEFIPAGNGAAVTLPRADLATAVRAYERAAAEQKGVPGLERRIAEVELTQAHTRNPGRDVTQANPANVNPPPDAPIVRQVRAESPAGGLGGISFNATAELPFSPTNVASVSCCSGDGRMLIRFRNGRVVRAPYISPSVLQLAYLTAYVHGEKAELSIGRTIQEGPNGVRYSQLNPPGLGSVYYYGRAKDTALGLAMYQADSLLDRIAFGGGQTVARLSVEVPGYRSLPELFPERYANNPAQERVAGTERVVIYSSEVALALSEQRDELTFAQTRFGVRFSQPGPAETAYAQLLQTNFEAIASTPEGRPFAELRPFAQALALFRYFKVNDIPVSGINETNAPAFVYTPSAVPRPTPPQFADVAPPLPTIFFGPFGPVRMIDRNGAEVRFAYQQGKIVKIVRPDGASFVVYRNMLGQPIAFKSGNNGFAFIYSGRDGLILGTDASLSGPLNDLNVAFASHAKFLPISNAEEAVATEAMRFAQHKSS